MRTFQEIKDNYHFTKDEFDLLTDLLPVIEPVADQIVEDYQQILLELPDTAKLLQGETARARLLNFHRRWLLAVFKGPYDDRYFQSLKRIGHAHMRIGLSAHFVYVGMNFLRNSIKQIIAPQLEPHVLEMTFRVIDKALDLNLDVIARTYHEEELRRFFLSYKLDDTLIRFAHRFTFGLDLILIIGLIGVSLGVVGMFVYDIIHVFRTSPETGIVGALGSLLILWLMIELLEAQVDRLRGGSFKLNLFVGVGLVAFIRKILVTSLTHETMMVKAFYLGGILVLGVIFWLVSKVEADTKTLSR
jgi:uncharacterized membrane protein (DUF373 family)